MTPSTIVAETEERAALREAVAKLVGKEGPDYFLRMPPAHEEPALLCM